MFHKLARVFPARFIGDVVLSAMRSSPAVSTRSSSVARQMLLLLAGLGIALGFASADTTIHFSGNGDQLQAAINSAHRGATIELDSNVSLNSPLIIQDDLTLKGNVAGGRATITTDFYIRLVTVRPNSDGRAPRVDFENILFLHGYAHGGNGGIGFSGGGGGAGMGGALFVWEAFVVVDNCVFQSNLAIGGNGGYAQKDLSGGAGAGGGVEGNDGGLSSAADAAASHLSWGGGGGSLGGSVNSGEGSGGSAGNSDKGWTPKRGGGGGGAIGAGGLRESAGSNKYYWYPLSMGNEAGAGGYAGRRRRGECRNPGTWRGRHY